jgi:hypothetical protein
MLIVNIASNKQKLSKELMIPVRAKINEIIKQNLFSFSSLQLGK